MFWVGVAMVYVVITGLGLSLGRYLAERFRGHDDGGGWVDPEPAPAPVGPRHSLACPPLGSPFDRALMPGAFDEPAREHAA